MIQKELFEQLTKETSLDEIQGYLSKVFSLRGFDGQNSDQQMLLLIEEVGELAKALRKDSLNHTIDQTRSSNYDSVESEIADVFILLCAIANEKGIKIFDALKEKESKNINRRWT
jgi:NTP pyrophosphatase (non-canonical NTP hydrolase)